MAFVGQHHFVVLAAVVGVPYQNGCLPATDHHNIIKKKVYRIDRSLQAPGMYQGPVAVLSPVSRDRVHCKLAVSLGGLEPVGEM